MRKQKLFAVLLCAAMLISLLPTTVLANEPVKVYVTGDITTDTTWPAGDYYICKVDNREPRVTNGATLTIEFGAKVYFSTLTTATLPGTESDPKNPYSSLTVTNGTLSATGVIFTTVPDAPEQTTWQNAGWNGIQAIGAGTTGATSLSFTNCTFEYSGFSDAGTLYGTQTNSIDSEVNISVSGCTLSNPKAGATAVRYNNGSNTVGSGSVSATNSNFTGYGRGVQIEQNGDDAVNTTVSGCTFSNISIRPLEINGGRQAVVTGNSFNNFVAGQHDNPVLIYDSDAPTSTDQTVTLTGNTFNYGTDANIYPVIIGAGCKINEDITSPTITFDTDYPAAYRYIVISRGVGYLNNHRNAVWDDAGIPYLLASEITITGTDAINKSSLTIKPGVTVCLGDGSGSDNLTVRGDLTAIGTADQPITFTKKTGVTYGSEIAVSNTLRGSITLKHCVIDGLYRGIGIISPSASAGLISLENCTVRNTQEPIVLNGYNVLVKNCALIGKGIWIDGVSSANSIMVEDCSITSSGANNDFGVGIRATKSVTLKNCLIAGFGDCGVAIINNSYQTLADGAPLIENCTISGNSYGVVFSKNTTFTRYGAFIRNSIISGNAGLDLADKVYISGTSNYPVTIMDGSIAYSLIGDDGSSLTFDGSGYYEHPVLGKIIEIATSVYSNRITGDPLFADATSGDHHLKSTAGRWNGSTWVADAVTSPCIDAGDPASAYANEPTPNGGRINLGCYGNTAEASKSAGSPPPVATFTITYNNNGGNGSMMPGTATAETPFVLPSCTFTAPINKQFKEWAIGSLAGTNVSAGNTHTFTEDTTVYAIWEDVSTTAYTITVSASPATGGTVSGGGSVNAGASVTVTATPNESYRFVRWSEGGAQVSTSANLTFNATSNRTLVAVFESIPQDNPPTPPVTTPSPVTEIGSSESITVDNIERLISEEETLTVGGGDGAKLVFDTESLKGISEQAGGSVKMEIANVSDEYQQSHPGKLVFSLTVNSGDKVITDFGGSVTVSLPYELNEGEAADNVTVWHLTASGVLVAIPCTYDPATKLVSFTVSHFSLYMVGVASPWENPFADVSESDWFYDAVRFVHENDLMVGTDKSTFCSQDIASRGMIVTILWLLEGAPVSENSMTFTDVAEDKWYYNAIAWAVEKGIVDGYNTLHFGPDDDITREQMVKILYRFATYKRYDVSSREDLSAFTDCPSDWAMESVQWAVAEKIIQGKGFNLLDLQAGVKRCECAAILQRFCEDFAK
ncbi:MAG: hypothetical protein EOM54_11145 [Clostridia bacterium]|nr:hypothetical protein [Clostridia bacterium]